MRIKPELEAVADLNPAAAFYCPADRNPVEATRECAA
jgi:hypothetical protein